MYTRAYYHLTLKNGKIASIKSDSRLETPFKKPVTDKHIAKLYIVIYKSDVIYVGSTKQDIRSRLRYGFTAKGKHGYYGYSWKNLQKVDLCILCFPKRTTKQVEAIEAELVYLIRHHTGRWPEYQTEIHFNNIPKKEKLLAESIYHSIE